MDWVALLQNLAFPIVVAVACGWYVKYREDVNDKKIETLTVQHHAEVEGLTSSFTSSLKEISTAVQNNTVIMEKLYTLMGEEN